MRAADISVVICAYTEARWDDLLAAVESLRRQTVHLREVILVIDYNPGLFHRAGRHIADAIIVENQEEKGLSGARNTGIKLAKGEIIAFMDEDATARPDWAERLLAEYRDPQVLGVGGQIDPAWVAGRPRWFPPEFDWVVGCSYGGMPQTVTPVRNLIGCNMSFRREVFDALEGFRNGIGRVEARPLGCEETELCIRINQKWPNHQLIYQPQALVDHRVPVNRGSWPYFRARCFSEGWSKALISRFVGVKDGLSSEWSYTFRVLPSAILRGIREAWRGDLTGLARSAVIIAGLATTALGYAVGRLQSLTISQQIQPVTQEPRTAA